MKIFKTALKHLITIAIISVPGIALADYKSDIITSCTDYQQGRDNSEINACKLYIDGFIDSSLLNEDAIEKPKAMIGKKESDKSEFLQRAYRTRMVTSRASLTQETNYQFCIPVEYNRKAVASRVAKALDVSSLSEKALNEVVFIALVNEFPCGK
jgi:hypothetical protein